MGSRTQRRLAARAGGLLEICIVGGVSAQLTDVYQRELACVVGGSFPLEIAVSLPWGLCPSPKGRTDGPLHPLTIQSITTLSRLVSSLLPSHA